jgi:xanthine dehydrogenase accessory factor
MSETSIISKLHELLQSGEAAVLCTLISKEGSGPRDEGTKMLVDSKGKPFGTIGGGGMERQMIEKALKALKEGRPRTMTFAMGVEPREGAISIDSKCGGEVKIFMDVIKPVPRLIVIGSGHIGKPVADLAHLVGFEVVVIDDAEITTRERFPYALEVRSGPYAEELNSASDFVAIVHGETDYELRALRRFLKLGVPYIGLLGSRNKASEHRKQLLDEGFTEDMMKVIRTPIGLEIGAVTPEEIAVSVVAELIKAKRG